MAFCLHVLAGPAWPLQPPISGFHATRALQVPPTMRFALDGEMPPWLLAKDLILHIIGEISVSGEPPPLQLLCG